MTAALLDRSTAREPTPRAARRPSKPRLQVLDQAAARRRSRHRMALLILFVTVLVGFFAVAFVHAELVAGQNDLDAIRSEIKEAEARHAELARAVEEASAPGVIMDRAINELGMVKPEELVYLTATGPVREIHVQPALGTLIASEGPASGRSATLEVVASSGPSAQGETSAADRALRGSLGLNGGISAAVQLPNPSAAVPSSSGVAAAPTGGGTLAGASTGQTDAPAGAATSAGVTAVSSAGDAAVSTAAGVTAVSAAGETAASTADGAVTPPVSRLAGSRAVSGTAGVVASTSMSGLATAAAATGSG